MISNKHVSVKPDLSMIRCEMSRADYDLLIVSGWCLIVRSALFAQEDRETRVITQSSSVNFNKVSRKHCRLCCSRHEISR